MYRVRQRKKYLPIGGRRTVGVSLLQWISIMVILLTLFEGLKAYRRGREWTA